MNKFTDSIWSIFYNETYLIRKYLYRYNKKFAPLLKGKVLDFGCGDKPYNNLFTNVTEMVGLDFPQKKDRNDLGTETDIIEYDGENIPLGDNSFDGVISTEVFEHLFNLDRSLSEINRVLKKGGTLYFTCPFTFGEHEAPYDYARYTRFALQDLLSKHGFENIEVHKTGNMVSVILQYCALFIYYIINRLGFLKPLLFVLFVSPIFILSNIINIIFPSKWLRKDVYHNNVVICTKA